ncbi:MAG: NUDIX domain-containing protein [Nanoarchaeota archaeon]|nr:NUDIX domain-containing protein [Nanoarchaeota archaeon]
MDIEKEILEKLMYNTSLNYNSLWDKKKYPSSKFNYHLKKLVQDELLNKNDKKEYELTQRGNQYIAELNNRKLEKQTIPLTCSFVLCINKNKKVLLQKRKKQPYLGIINIPGGKVQFGESIYDAGIRELYEESKLKTNLIQLRLIDEVRTYDLDNILFAHIIAYTYVCYDFEGELEKENLEGEMKWYSLEEIQELENIFPNLKKIIPELIRDKFEAVVIQETKRFKDEDGNFIKYEIKRKN